MIDCVSSNRGLQYHILRFWNILLDPLLPANNDRHGQSCQGGKQILRRG